MSDVIVLDDWKRKRASEVVSYLPNNFSDLNCFLIYCETNSRTPRAQFSLEEANSLLQMAGREPLDKFSSLVRVKIREDKMKGLLETIREKIKYL